MPSVLIKTVIVTLLFFSSLTIISQNRRASYFFAKQQVELKHDNDFILSTDKYYTTGNFIGYRKLINEATSEIDKKQFSIYIEQTFFTPSNIISSNVDDYDRPYAGFLGLSNSLSLTNENRMLDFSLTIGVTGEISGSEGLQSSFHRTNNSQNPSWQSQIDNNTHVNLYGSYLREWQILDRSISSFVALKPTIALGTKDYYLQNELAVYFGKRNDISHTMAYRQLGDIDGELFFAVKGTYRYVIHDAMLQGSIIADNSEFTLEPTDHLMMYTGECFWRTRRQDFKVGYHYNTRRTPTTSNHSFVTFSISRNF